MNKRVLQSSPRLFNGKNYIIFLNTNISISSKSIDDFICSHNTTAGKLITANYRYFDKYQYMVGSLISSFVEAGEFESEEEYKNNYIVSYNGLKSTSGAIGVAISMAKNEYSAKMASSKKIANLSSYYVINEVVTWLKESKYVVKIDGYHNSDGSGRRTAIFLTQLGKEWLKKITETVDYDDLHDYAEVKVRSKDGSQIWLDNDISKEWSSMMLKVGELNGSSFSIPVAQVCVPEYIVDQKSLFTYNRIFNKRDNCKDLENGGRFYCLAQQMSKSQRLSILCNSNDVIEADFKALQPSMLYHITGLQAPADVYAIDLPEYHGYKIARDDIKIIVNTLLNASTEDKARRSLSNMKVPKDNKFLQKSNVPDELRKTCSQFVEECITIIKEKLSPIAQYFGSGVGLRLQRLDSDIAYLVMSHFANRNIACFGIHDSFIVDKQHENLLKETMIKAYKIVVNTDYDPKITVSRKDV